MFCKECGTQINDNAKFCSKCGRNAKNALNENPQSVNKSSLKRGRIRSFFSWNGKISQKSYLISQVSILLLALLVPLSLYCFPTHIITSTQPSIFSDNRVLECVLAVLWILLFILSILSVLSWIFLSAFLDIKRIRDAGASVFYVIIYYILAFSFGMWGATEQTYYPPDYGDLWFYLDLFGFTIFIFILFHLLIKGILLLIPSKIKNNLQRADTQEAPSKASEGIAFTLKGRINSNVYWKYMAIVLPISIVSNFLAYSFSDEWMALLFLILIPVIFLGVIADVRRFHDFNLTGWAVIPMYILIGIISVVISSVMESPFIDSIFSVIVVVVVANIPSTKGANKYGSKSNVR